MGRIVVVRHNGKVVCLPSWVYRNRDKYELIAKVNKPWNPYYVDIIKKYLKNK